nr:MAG TPA: hypothetical protein [Bacteriophage sp.]
MNLSDIFSFYYPSCKSTLFNNFSSICILYYCSYLISSTKIFTYFVSIIEL